MYHPPCFFHDSQLKPCTQTRSIYVSASKLNPDLCFLARLIDEYFLSDRPGRDEDAAQVPGRGPGIGPAGSPSRAVQALGGCTCTWQPSASPSQLSACFFFLLLFWCAKNASESCTLAVCRSPCLCKGIYIGSGGRLAPADRCNGLTTDKLRCF